MKPQHILISIACEIALTGCANSQAQTNTISPEVLTSTVPADTQTVGAEISKAATEKTSSYQCKGTNNHY